MSSSGVTTSSGFLAQCGRGQASHRPYGALAFRPRRRLGCRPRQKGSSVGMARGASEGARVRRPGLSVCCLSGGPPERLAAILRLLRPVADEIVVGVDDRVDLRALGPVQALADRL